MMLRGLLRPPPEKGEPQLVKHGYDAFQVPDLEKALLESGIGTVVVTGVVTELCVRATAISAFERGFFPVVPRECTATTEPEAAREALDAGRHNWF